MDGPIQDVIEKLLTLQDRDRRLFSVKDQLARVAPERQMLQDKAVRRQGQFGCRQNKDQTG